MRLILVFNCFPAGAAAIEASASPASASVPPAVAPVSRMRKLNTSCLDEAAALASAAAQQSGDVSPTGPLQSVEHSAAALAASASRVSASVLPAAAPVSRMRKLNTSCLDEAAALAAAASAEKSVDASLTAPVTSTSQGSIEAAPAAEAGALEADSTAETNL